MKNHDIYLLEETIYELVYAEAEALGFTLDFENMDGEEDQRLTMLARHLSDEVITQVRNSTPYMLTAGHNAANGITV